MFISDIFTTIPLYYKTPLQQMVYETLSKLDIPFQRVETDEIITMEDCALVNQKLQVEMVKTLFLCNRQKTDFYLFVTCGNKQFDSKMFSKALGISRVSFAPANLMEPMLGTRIGAATVFSVLLDKEGKIKIVFDKNVASDEWYGCSDGTTTGYMRLKTKSVMDLLTFLKHCPKVLEIDQ